MVLDKTYECSLDLMRRLPPQNVEKNLADLIDIAPEKLLEDLLATVDQPLKVAICKETKRQYLLCDYNRDGDSYRSPWSNKYDPHISDGSVPSQKIRELEINLNSAFDQYRELYYNGGVSSVYLWDTEPGKGFAGVVLIKKAGEGSQTVRGCWDSVHVLELFESKKGKDTNVKVKLTSTVMLWLNNKGNNNDLNLGGNMTRQAEMSAVINENCTYIECIGKIIEDMENKMRQTMSDIYFGKIKDITNGLRATESLEANKKWANVANDLNARLQKKS